MRDTLLAQPNVKEVAVDYDAGLAYVTADGEFDFDKARKALMKGGKYDAALQ